ncbi:hypothetical protein CCASP_01470 [Corynebacterium caspium DSM 44850]|nr:hypothetical protein CCASP_01470 [Corynebacterium caspium DSM 44850]
MVCLGLVATLGLGACGGGSGGSGGSGSRNRANAVETPLLKTTWQLSGIYLNPADPGALPQDAAGTVEIVFGQSTIAGISACGPIRGQVEYLIENQPARPEEATAIRFQEMDFSITDAENCIGGRAYVQEKIRTLLSGDFLIQRPGADSLALTAATTNIDAPVLRWVSR